jgi:hypothetical protein
MKDLLFFQLDRSYMNEEYIERETPEIFISQYHNPSSVDDTKIQICNENAPHNYIYVEMLSRTLTNREYKLSGI